MNHIHIKYFVTILLSAIISFSGMGQTIDALKAKAEKGSVSAQMELAKRYMAGDGVDESTAEAVKWFEKAAEKGNVEAMVACGELYCTSITNDSFSGGWTPDYIKGLHHLKEASKRGNEEATKMLTNFMAYEGLKDGECPYDYLPCDDEFDRYNILKKNEDIIETEYANHNPIAAYYLAVLSCSNDFDKAFEYLNEAYSGILSSDNSYSDFIESPDGFNNEEGVSHTLKIKVASLLGWCHEFGKGTTIDYKKAAEYYLIHYGTQYHQWEEYAKLRGAFCYKKAKMYKEFIDLANMDSSTLNRRIPEIKSPFLQYELARMYENGEGVSKDPKKALEIYESIVDSRNISYGTGIDPSMNQSDEIGRAALKASKMYSSGIGCKPDKDMADLYFEIALKYGNSDAWREKGL